MPSNFPTATTEASGQNHTPGRVWDCKIGARYDVEVPAGGDYPMRQAIERAFQEITGRDPEFIFSGWGGKLTESELAVVENREPSDGYRREVLLREAAPDLLAALKETWRVLRAAGTLNLTNGVQLGRTSWYVKICDAEALSDAAIAKTEA